MDNRLRKPTKEVFQIHFINGTTKNYNTEKYELRMRPNENWVYIFSTVDGLKTVNRIPATSILEIETKMI